MNNLLGVCRYTKNTFLCSLAHNGTVFDAVLLAVSERILDEVPGVTRSFVALAGLEAVKRGQLFGVMYVSLSSWIGGAPRSPPPGFLT